MRVEHLDRVALRVSDLDRSVAWYTGVLGLEREHVEAWGDYPVVAVEWLEGSTVAAAAAAVADELPGEHAYLVEGIAEAPDRGWPDAVSVSALAARQRTPVLLATRDGLPPETRAALADRERITIVGGTAAVSAAVEEELRGMGLEVDRLSGSDRYGTSRAVARVSEAAGLSDQRLWVVTGTNFPDALAAGPAAAKAGAVLLLVHGQDLAHSPAAAAYLAAARPREAVLVGGVAAVSRYAAMQVAQQLR